MAAKPQQQESRDGAISALNVAIDGLNLAKEISSITPAKAVFGSVGILLVMVKVGSYSVPRESLAYPRLGFYGQ